MFFSSFTGACQ